MNRKMIGWIALAVVVVGALFYGMNAALGSEPAPKNAKPHVTRVSNHKPADASNDTGNMIETAKDLMEAFKGDDNATEGESRSPFDILKDLGKDKDK